MIFMHNIARFDKQEFECEVCMIITESQYVLTSIHYWLNATKEILVAYSKYDSTT